MTRFRQFNSVERNRLAGALRTAIDIYQNDAANLRKELGHMRMADEFEGYAKDCAKLLDELEGEL